MKKIIASLIVLFAGANAQAAAYKCENLGPYSETDYLVVVNGDSGLVLTNDNGYFQVQEGEVRVAIAMDGGPTSVSLVPQLDVDWSEEENCYVWGGTIRHIRIHTRTNGDIGSRVQLMPNILVDPARRRCAIPRVALAPPQTLNCELLK